MALARDGRPADLPAHWSRAFDDVERRVGGRVVAAERQPRWRPAWFLDVERPDGEIVPICFRGARREAERGVAQLRHEYACQTLLERHGIPVPRVYGLCPDPVGIVMARAPGRANLATADGEEERRAVLGEYVEWLARVHQLDLAPFEAAGLRRPASARERALGDLPGWVAAYRKGRGRPEPLIEFAIRWLERNAPEDREHTAFLLGDAGQFLFEDGRVTALLDVELACLGDPAADLGALFSRDLSEPLGDLSEAVARYEACAGGRVDRRVVLYHAVRFGMVTPLATAPVVAAPPPSADLVQYLVWYVVYSRCPLEVVAHLEGVEVPPAALPDPEPTPWSAAHDALCDRLSARAAGDAFARYERDALARLAEVLRRADRYGPALEADDRRDAAGLLGRMPGDAADRDAALEALVAQDDPARDADLLRYFVRRMQRQEFLLAPVLRELAGARMQTLR